MRSRRWLTDSTLSVYDGTMSEREVLIPERVSASFGHGRSHLDHDGSATAKILCSATLCDSGCLLLLWQPSRSVPRCQHMHPEAQSVVECMLDCLWAMGVIVR